MGVVFAFESLFAECKKQIESSTSARVVVEMGKSRVPAQLNYGLLGRVLFVPGNVDGDLGQIGDSEQWPLPAQGLSQLDEVFTVFVYGHDPQSQIQGDFAHFHVFKVILHEALRQLHNATHHHPAITSPIKYGRARLLKPMETSILGYECMIPCQTQQPIIDAFDGQLTIDRVHPQMILTDTVQSGSDTDPEVSITQPEA